MPKMSINLLPTTSANLDHSPLNVIGTNYHGAGYYPGGDGVHTIAQYISDFVGVLKIQVALEFDPKEEDWATVSTFEHTDVANPVTSNETYNFTGNYVWVRAVVENMTHGTIAKLQMNY